VENVEDEMDPCLDSGSGLVLVARQVHMSKIAVLEFDPGNMEDPNMRESLPREHCEPSRTWYSGGRHDVSVVVLV
jgi:hypothetical protein